jgi:hypothetical protein
MSQTPFHPLYHLDGGFNKCLCFFQILSSGHIAQFGRLGPNPPQVFRNFRRKMNSSDLQFVFQRFKIMTDFSAEGINDRALFGNWGIGQKLGLQSAFNRVASQVQGPRGTIITQQDLSIFESLKGNVKE